MPDVRGRHPDIRGASSHAWRASTCRSERPVLWPPELAGKKGAVGETCPQRTSAIREAVARRAVLSPVRSHAHGVAHHRGSSAVSAPWPSGLRPLRNLPTCFRNPTDSKPSRSGVSFEPAGQAVQAAAARHGPFANRNVWACTGPRGICNGGTGRRSAVKHSVRTGSPQRAENGQRTQTSATARTPRSCRVL